MHRVLSTRATTSTNEDDDMSEISEQNLPGIGRSYTLVTRDGAEVLTVLHNSGRRDLYVTADDRTPRVSVALNDDEARQLGAVLSGAYFKPAVVARVEALIGGLLIDWVTVPSPRPRSTSRSPSSRSAGTRA